MSLVNDLIQRYRAQKATEEKPTSTASGVSMPLSDMLSMLDEMKEEKYAEVQGLLKEAGLPSLSIDEVCELGKESR